MISKIVINIIKKSIKIINIIKATLNLFRAPKSLGFNTRKIMKDEKYEMSMLEIALTASESRKLMEESWDIGVNDGCTSGRGRCL